MDSPGRKKVLAGRRGLLSTLPAVLLLGLCSVARAAGPENGRLSGSVLDTQGNPLMGATVLIMGPMLSSARGAQSAAERIITDAQGRFTAEHLLPGWYSLKVTSPARLPVLRNSIRVEAGQTSREKVVLTDVFVLLRFKVPESDVSILGDDWKWVLRTSARTRPVLRYQQVARNSKRDSKPPLPASQRLIGIIPGSAQQDTLGEDPGMGSVLAYIRPLSDSTDLLVAGSMAADGLQTSSVATAIRKNLSKGDPQELALAVHQLSFAEGIPLPGGDIRQSLSHAQAMVVSYSHTRRITDALSLTTGFRMDYLNAATDAMAARPQVELDYQLNPSNVLALRYGGLGTNGGDNTLLNRISMLNTFPRVTLRDFRPEIQELKHAEASLNHKLGRTSHLEVAAYRDSLDNAAIMGFGTRAALGWLPGDVLPNPVLNGVTLNAGNYRSAGLRAAYWLDLGSSLKTAVIYANGDSLAVNSSSARAQGNLRDVIHPAHSESVGGKVSARIPKWKTQVTTSYQWMQRGRVTGLDPYGQANLQIEPFLGVQIRQPLPTVAFLPAHIEALADFRNLLAQGYQSLSASGGDRLLLTPIYRSFRGGFSVQF